MDEEITEQSSDGRTWVSDGWTARVQKNEDDEGWAVAMTRDGDAEPVLVSPWTMGRDKKNPKPLNPSDFKTLLKAARDVVARHEAHQRAMLHKSVTISDKEIGTVRVDLDIVPDEDDPRAILSAWNNAGDKLGERVVPPSFKLSSQVASKWASAGFGSDLRAPRRTDVEDVSRGVLQQLIDASCFQLPQWAECGFAVAVAPCLSLESESETLPQAPTRPRSAAIRLLGPISPRILPAVGEK